jgi:hypothetical protein
MPFDTPLHDLAAVHYAVHPDSGFFTLSDPGTVTVKDDGTMQFAAGSGNIYRLSVEPSKSDAAIEGLIAIATAAPATPASRAPA